MQKMLFIGFEFHRKTGSAEFILELFRSRFDLTTLWVDLFADDPYCGVGPVAGEYDILVCWQAMPPVKWLGDSFTFQHAVLFPMQDGCPSVSKPEKWYPYRDFQIICFSSTLCRSLHRAGFSVHGIRYFPRPGKVGEWGAVNSAFFWFRRPKINCELAEILLAESGVQKIHLHNSPDPGVDPVSFLETGPIEYSFSTWFDDKRALQNKIAESSFYIAPREKEGIGMSFVEAMAAGRCVVAPDQPTMNEYIEHGKTGVLYDLDRPKPLRMDDVRRIQQQAYRSVMEGFSRWEKEKAQIFDWMTAPVKIARWRLFFFAYGRSISDKSC